jgi:nucleoside-diphosphate-sugar epimerase
MEEYTMNNNKNRNELYIVTGAAGNLGSAIVRNLVANAKAVRSFVLPRRRVCPALDAQGTAAAAEADCCPASGAAEAGFHARACTCIPSRKG